MEKRIGYEVRQLMQLIKHHIELTKQADNLDLGFVQVSTISIIMHADHDVFQKDIEQKLNIRRSTATKILDVLERDGYIIRESVAYDKRLKKLCLTSKANDAFELMMNHLTDLENRLKANLSPKQINDFFEIVAVMKENIQIKEEEHD